MNMKELVKRVLDVDFAFPVTEVPSDGVFVRYDGHSAEVGGATKPALARAYMLLAKAVSDGEQEVSIHQTAYFDTCGVMLDMSFGSVTKVAGVKKYLDYMAIFGMNMLMLYTEDTYEIEGHPLFGYQRGRYTAREIGKYLDGTIDSIEALEAEIVEGVPTKYLWAPRVMSTYADE